MSASSSTTRILTALAHTVVIPVSGHEHRASARLARSGGLRQIDNVANELTGSRLNSSDADRKPSLLPCPLLGVASPRRAALRAGGGDARRASRLGCQSCRSFADGAGRRRPTICGPHRSSFTRRVGETCAAPGRTAGRVRIRGDVDRWGRGGGRLRPERASRRPPSRHPLPGRSRSWRARSSSTTRHGVLWSASVVASRTHTVSRSRSARQR